jgi:hypothetical protein
MLQRYSASIFILFQHHPPSVTPDEAGDAFATKLYKRGTRSSPLIPATSLLNSLLLTPLFPHSIARTLRAWLYWLKDKYSKIRPFIKSVSLDVSRRGWEDVVRGARIEWISARRRAVRRGVMRESRDSERAVRAGLEDLWMDYLV